MHHGEGEGTTRDSTAAAAKQVELKLHDLDGQVSNVSGACPDLSFEIGNTYIRTQKTLFKAVACGDIAEGMFRLFRIVRSTSRCG